VIRHEGSPDTDERTKLHQHVWETDPDVALKEVAGYFAPATKDKQPGTGAVNLQVISRCVEMARGNAVAIRPTVDPETFKKLSDEEKVAELAIADQLVWMPNVACKTNLEQLKPSPEYQEARADVGLGRMALEVTALRDPSIVATEAYAELALLVDEASMPLDTIAGRF
jgi:hypothetical protein